MTKEEIEHIKEALLFGRACAENVAGTFSMVGTQNIDKALAIIKKNESWLKE